MYIQSLLAHLEEVRQFTDEYFIDVLALTEARITPDILDEELVITGYKHIRCNSYNRYTGAVICYIKDNIRFEKI